MEIVRIIILIENRIQMFEINNERKNNSNSGQISIFAALIFQVLFVFFAMMVNVGLLVHHKINLQNSVDLAAYYAAGKQAEMLNAVSHMNYQLHQSFKLLMFRYHQLGMSGMSKASDNTNHPYTAPGNVFLPSSNNDTVIGSDTGVLNGIDTAFCLAYPPMSHVNSDENYCKRKADQFKITLPGKPDVPTGLGDIFLGFAKALNASSQKLREIATHGCKQVTAINWMVLARFMYTYKMDIANRKKLLIALARAASGENVEGVKDFYDIEGESVRKGAFKTLYKNLSFPSQESIGTKYKESDLNNSGDNFVKFDLYNGLGEEHCGLGPDPDGPPKWLSEIFTYYPMLFYDGNCDTFNGQEFVSFFPGLLNQFSAVNSSPNVVQIFGQQAVNEMGPFIVEGVANTYDKLQYKASLGFEKNPWCMAYVGVSAKVTPKIPFSPLGDVTMTARSFAKPFGGRIGPWYGSKWFPGDNKSKTDPSNPNSFTDPSSPYRVEGNQDLQTLDTEKIAPYQGRSHARYIGDRVGVRSNITMAQMSAAIHKSAVVDGGVDIDGWSHALGNSLFTAAGQTGDYLHWNKDTNKETYMRKLELLSVVPDDFDRTYYSIDPDFYRNYLVKIKNANYYKNKLGGAYLFRGDLGSRMNDPNLEDYSVRKQIMDARSNFATPPPDLQTKLIYLAQTFGSLLTSWQSVNPEDYLTVDPNRFAQCNANHKPLTEDELKDPNKTTPGSCKQGGRVGYSVKIVDGKSLQENQLMLGGQDVTGELLNKPPTNF